MFLHRLFPSWTLILLITVTGCGSLNLRHHVDEEVQRAARMLTGCFDSKDQAMEDPENYFQIRLILVPIWPEDKIGHWMYVEQASFQSLERPYRQRIQHVYRDGNSQIRSDVYLLPGDPLEFAGGWVNPDEMFAALTPQDLTLREGCSVLLKPDEAGFVGSTVGEECQSSLGGAQYATSEVTLSDGLLVSWDRGWNSSGEQVWGATAGGYRFVYRGLKPTE